MIIHKLDQDIDSVFKIKNSITKDLKFKNQNSLSIYLLLGY